MTSTSNTVENAANMIRERIAELDAERESLVSAIEAMTGSTTTTTTKRSPRKRSNKSQSTKSKGPRKNDRKQAIVDHLAKAKGPVTVADLAKAFDIKPNYLYRVIPTMVEAGLIVKDGKTVAAVK